MFRMWRKILNMGTKRSAPEPAPRISELPDFPSLPGIWSSARLKTKFGEYSFEGDPVSSVTLNIQKALNGWVVRTDPGGGRQGEMFIVAEDSDLGGMIGAAIVSGKIAMSDSDAKVHAQSPTASGMRILQGQNANKLGQMGQMEYNRNAALQNSILSVSELYGQQVLEPGKVWQVDRDQFGKIVKVGE